MSLGTFLANPLGSITGQIFGSGQQGTIWNNNGDKYQIPSATESANQFSGSGLDPNGLVAGLWNDITGQTAQSREFAQQEYLQDKMNAYNHPVEQMKREKEAGVNPNLAAAGIAQAGSQSAQAPAVASNASGVANGLAAAAGTIASLGTGAQGLAAATETTSLLKLRAEQIKSETIANLEKAGVDHWNALSVATLLPTMQANQVADFYLKMAQYDNTRQQYQLILDEHDLNLENIRLTGSKADEAAENARFAKAETDFFIAHGYRDDAPLDVSLRNSIVTGRKGEAGSIAGAIETASNRAAYGAYKADADTAYERMYNSAKGSAAGNAEYADYLNDLEIYKENVTNFMEMWYELPDSLKGFAVQFLGKELYGLSSGLAGVDKKPQYNPTKIDNTSFVVHTRNKYGRKSYSARW